MKDPTELVGYTGEFEVVSASELAEKLANEEPGVKVHPRNMPSLNAYMDGFEAGELIIVSGPPGSGKSLLSQGWSRDFAEMNPLWFQYELTYRQFFRCFGEDLPLMYLPRKLKSAALDWMEERICESIAKYGTGIVFIDHLHYLFDMVASSSPSLQIGQVIRWLKQSICIAYDIPVVMMAHMTKIKPGDEPSAAHVRDSGLIEGECDTLLVIWRNEVPENSATIKCEKLRRNGENKFKRVDLIKRGGFLYEIDKTHDTGNGRHISGQLPVGDRDAEGVFDW